MCLTGIEVPKAELRLGAQSAPLPPDYSSAVQGAQHLGRLPWPCLRSPIFREMFHFLAVLYAAPNRAFLPIHPQISPTPHQRSAFAGRRARRIARGEWVKRNGALSRAVFRRVQVPPALERESSKGPPRSRAGLVFCIEDLPYQHCSACIWARCLCRHFHGSNETLSTT